MKKIIIVNNNMKVGGVQKSLCNLLRSLDGRYDVTLLLFRAAGAYLDQIPSSVKVVECGGLFRFLGISQAECRGNWPELVKRSFLAMVSRVFGRPAVTRIALAGQKWLPEEYDCAISFLHNVGIHSLNGCCQEFVLERIKAKRKVAFLHCDHRGCGGNYPDNNRNLARFDRIAACSEGCRRAFLECVPELADKCVAVRNCHDYEQIRILAGENPVEYEKNCLNVVMVGRLAPEKAVHRAIHALARARAHGAEAVLHLVGGGKMRAELEALTGELGLSGSVRFYGEQSNPYRFMAGADLLVLSSYHEAAPMVIEEAACLALPVLTVETTSSREMVAEAGRGWVCENSQQALDQAMTEILSQPERLRQLRLRLRQESMNNQRALDQFAGAIGG